MGHRVLIVDDETDLAELLAYNLQRAGYETRVVSDGRAGLEAVDAFGPELVILDVMMPGLTGTEVAQRLRRDARTRHIPIIMLTAKAEESSELDGLSSGADDYLTKPFSMRVLEARIEAVLRRARGVPEPKGSVLRAGPLEVNVEAHVATVNGRPLKITVTEFKLLEALVAAEGRVLSRQALITRALGPDVTVTERTVDVHVTSIRKKLGEHADLLRTVRGVGYRLTADSAALPGGAAVAASSES